MNFRSIRDLGDLIRDNLDVIPGDVDLVVAVPRSGIIPAAMIALARNLPVTDIDGLLEQRLLERQGRRKVAANAWPPRHVLVVDDSVASGKSLTAVRERFAELPAQTRVSYLAAYGWVPGASVADIVLETLPNPRAFEWNLFHHDCMEWACLEIDGVLCAAPGRDAPDDGPRYRDVLRDAKPLFLPSKPVASLVTARREEYRVQTEDWLQRHGVRYGELIMLDETDADRRRFGLAIKHKADVYRRKGDDIRLFVEGDLWQAREIAALSGRMVISVEQLVMFAAGRSYVTGQRARRYGRALLERLGLAAR